MNIKDGNKNKYIECPLCEGHYFCCLKAFKHSLKEGLVNLQCLEPLDPKPDGSMEPLGMTCGTISTFAHTREKNGLLRILQTCDLEIM